MKQLIHNGVLIPKYEYKKLHIFVRSKRINLTPQQEEMAVAWVRKLDTEYVKDPVFVRNFFRDFRKALNINEDVSPEAFDFSVVWDYVLKERERKLSLTREERKILAQQRKALREANKEKYGYAIVDGVKVEVSSYVVEPSSIFMGRGKHPLRGKWKSGAGEEDMILNLSPDAQIPGGSWKKIVWQPNSMWVAKWRDRLRGKMKYVWLSEASSIRQKREIEKYDLANELGSQISKVRTYIWSHLQSEDSFAKKVATVSYLIDELSLRVGDEKDRDEANTVGATTLRPNHIKTESDGWTAFSFLGKNAVRWRKKIKLPEQVTSNLREFIAEANSTVFNGIRSKDVNLFLGEAMAGLTAKVFRTHHASGAVRSHLMDVKVTRSDPDHYKKYVATMAKLQAAIVCNHKKKVSDNWPIVLHKKQEAVRKSKDRLSKRKNKVMKRREKIKELYAKRKVAKRKRKKTITRRINKERQQLQKDLKRLSKAKEKVDEKKTKVTLMKKTKGYNLNTSLKSYIDPRIFYEWGKDIGFDWKLHYPKALQRKFSWVDNSGPT
jgi:DNA topoisomerase-1